MVVGQPYIHFKINNEPLEQTIDYNYTWATTVETDKGPVNQPVLISSASQAKAIFGVDMRPYFAQGADALIMVRVTGKSGLKAPSKGMYSFDTAEEITIYRAEQVELEVYEFTSYSDVEGTTEWGKGTVQPTGIISNGYTEVEVLTNSTEASFVGRKFYIVSDAQVNSRKYELFEDEGQTSANIFVNIDEKYSYKLYYTFDGNDYIPLIENREAETGKLIPQSYVDKWTANGRSEPDANVYNANQVKPFLTPVAHIIPAGTSLFTVTSKYEGDYGITISTSKSLNSTENGDDGYTIVLTDPVLGTIRINNGYDVSKIVNRINDKGFNFEAKITNAGLGLSEVMKSYSKAINVRNITGFPTLIIPDGNNVSITEGTFISLAKTKQDGTTTYLTEEESRKISNNDSSATVELANYSMNLVEAGNQPLVGGSNGEWDAATERIPNEYQFDAHKTGLDLLRRLRIAGVFCMYGEPDIQRAFVEHGIDSVEPEKGMNNNETCKWRTILLGADRTDRDSKTSLAIKAAALNNQYTLLLGQGLIDTGVNGVMSKMTATQRHAIQEGASDVHQLLPYECTQYVAGLRAKLNYDESIFGGQGRKRIRGVGDLAIAPLFDYEEEYSWDPKTYIYLNEAGVLTFTEDYGHISLTDGVTTVQTGYEEDEEGTMNILKYTQNAIYDACLQYIGRNINTDLENSITMNIKSILERMKNTDQSIIDTDEYSAYELEVSLGSRNNQLLGKIYIYLKITPVHALRQIEVEMTVQ